MDTAAKPKGRSCGLALIACTAAISLCCSENQGPSLGGTTDPVTLSSPTNAMPLPPPSADAHTAARVPRIPDGLYAMGVALTEFGGLEIPFQIEVISREGPHGRQIIEHFFVRAVKEGQVSEVIADPGPFMVSELGTFEADSGDTSMPPAFSPTGSEVPQPC